MDFFSSIKEENRLVSKGMSNIYSKATIGKNLRSQNFDFLSLNNSSPGQFLGSFQLKQKNQRSQIKSVRGFSIILVLKGVMIC